MGREEIKLLGGLGTARRFQIKSVLAAGHSRDGVVPLDALDLLPMGVVGDQLDRSRVASTGLSAGRDTPLGVSW